MKSLIFLVFILFMANAVNLTLFGQGFGSSLKFNSSQIQDQSDCFDAVTADIDQIYQLLISRDFDSIAENLGENIIEIQSTFQTTCKPYIDDLLLYISNHTNTSDLKSTIVTNLEQSYPQIITSLGFLLNDALNGDTYNVGYELSLVVKDLLGALTYTGSSFDTTPSKVVPFNASEFFKDYMSEIFQLLGIQTQPNITALLQCYYPLQNFTITALYIKDKYSSLDFEQKLDAVQYLLGRGFKVIRNCGGALEVEELILDPILKAFEEDPVMFVLRTIDNIAIAFPMIQIQLKDEILAIQQGEYANAGFDKAGIITEAFQGLVNFSSS